MGKGEETDKSEEAELEAIFTSALEDELFLDREGRWFHQGTAFRHERLACLFHRNIRWDDELNGFVIRIGKGRATFRHDGYVRFVTSLREQDSELLLHFADDSERALNPAELRLTNADEFLLVQPELPPARFNRQAHQELLEYAESERSLLIAGRIYTVRYLSQDET